MRHLLFIWKKKKNEPEAGNGCSENGYHRVRNHVEFSLGFLDSDCIEVFWMVDGFKFC